LVVDTLALEAMSDSSSVMIALKLAIEALGGRELRLESGSL